MEFDFADSGMGRKTPLVLTKNTHTDTHKEYNTTMNTKLLCLYNNDSNVLKDPAFGHVLLQKLTYVDVQIWHVLSQFPSAITTQGEHDHMASPKNHMQP